MGLQSGCSTLCLQLGWAAQELTPCWTFAGATEDPPNKDVLYDRNMLAVDTDAGQDGAPTGGSEPTSEQLISFTDLGQISGVFSFTHLPASADQSKPIWLLSKFEAFVRSLQVSCQAS
jgi:hypothetical protein